MSKDKLIQLLPNLARGQRKPYWGLRFEGSEVYKWMPMPTTFWVPSVMDVLRHLGVVVACKADPTGQLEWLNGHKP